MRPHGDSESWFLYVAWAILFKTVLGCQYYLTSDYAINGTFRSPNFPDPYPHPTKCEYVFQGNPDQRLNVSFRVFDLAPTASSNSCVHDYLDVFTVSLDGNKRLLRRLCGGVTPAPIFTVHQRVEILFVAHRHPRGKRDFKGFLGNYAFVHERWQPFPSPPSCGSTYVTGDGGVIGSPGYPKPYPRNTDCTWTIRTQLKRRILLYFHSLDLGPRGCSDGNVSIYNGFAGSEEQPADIVCRKLEDYGPIRQFVSTGHRISIRFRAGSHRPGKGFQLVWAAISSSGHSIYTKGYQSIIIMVLCIAVPVMTITCLVILVSWIRKRRRSRSVRIKQNKRGRVMMEKPPCDKDGFPSDIPSPTPLKSLQYSPSQVNRHALDYYSQRDCGDGQVHNHDHATCGYSTFMSPQNNYESASTLKVRSSCSDCQSRTSTPTRGTGNKHGYEQLDTVDMTAVDHIIARKLVGSPV